MRAFAMSEGGVTVMDHQHEHEEEEPHEHSHGIGHAHAPKDFNRAFAAGVVLNLALVVAQIVFGLLAHSLALVAGDHHQIWMSSGGSLHIVWAHGPPGDPSTPMGYIFSPDYGATWTSPKSQWHPTAGGFLMVSLGQQLGSFDGGARHLRAPGVSHPSSIPNARQIRTSFWNGRGRVESNAR